MGKGLGQEQKLLASRVLAVLIQNYLSSVSNGDIPLETHKSSIDLQFPYQGDKAYSVPVEKSQ